MKELNDDSQNIQKRPRVLISGAGGGIGFACAENLAKKYSADLILTGRTLSSLEQAKQRLEQENPQVKVDIFVCDHSIAGDIEKLIEEIGQKDILPDGIIANVGINPVHTVRPRKIGSTPEHLLLDTFQTNVVNTHLLIAPFLKEFQRKGGRIVLVGSQAYQWGIKGQVAYNVSKAALVGYKNTLVSEYDGKGVFCHLVNPGLVANKRTEKLRKKIGDHMMVTEQHVAGKICSILIDSSENGLEINV